MNDVDIDAEKIKAWRAENRRRGAVRSFSEDKVAYNVEGTKEECPPEWSKKDWDEHWKYCTGENLTEQTCASCGCALTSSIRVGAHVRLYGEPEDNMAWIVLYCKSCNNSDQVQKVTKGSWLVRTQMSKIRKNVAPVK